MRVSQQIGWSQESKLIYNIIRQLEKLEIVWDGCCTTTTTTTIFCNNEVVIGTQTWKVCNLDVDTYANGDPIPQVTDPTEWSNLTTGAWCWYNNDSALGAIYGKLYNWYAVNDVRGLAPTGYHVPSDNEWNILGTYLGATAGGELKEIGTSHWDIPNTGATNSTGFTGLPGGYVDPSGGGFSNVGTFGLWWSSTEFDVPISINYFISFDNANLTSNVSNNKYGFSVRLLKD